MSGLAFEWDRRKDLENRRKHDVGFAEASTAFDDPLYITISDPDHGSGEERFVIVGTSSRRADTPDQRALGDEARETQISRKHAKRPTPEMRVDEFDDVQRFTKFER